MLPLASAAAPTLGHCAGLTGGRAENCPRWCQSGRKVPANVTAAEGDGTKDPEMLKPLNLVQGKWALAVGELRARCHLLSRARELGSLPTQAPLPRPRSSSGQQLAAGSKGSRCQGDVLPISVRFWLGVDVLLSPHQPCPSWREQGETRSICQPGPGPSVQPPWPVDYRQFASMSDCGLTMGSLCLEREGSNLNLNCHSFRGATWH